MEIKAVIMAGGKGTRFWPYSRLDCPKQFLPIMSEQTMLEMTVNRLLGIISPKDIYVVTSQQYFFLAQKHSTQIPKENIIVEPTGRDTAACIGLSAIKMIMKGEDPVLITLPADHFIVEEERYHHTLRLAVQKAEQEDCVVTLGVKPTRPETGYGYIRVNQAGREDGEIVIVDQFIEKPPMEMAESLFNDGNHFWNSGTFVWKASTILNLIQQHMPELHNVLAQIKKLSDQKADQSVLDELYCKIQKTSIDYGVIEKCQSIYMVPVNFIWDDVGNWNALERIGTSDECNNVVNGLHEGIDSKGCIIQSRQGQLVATIGIEDMVIVSTENVLLICPKNRVQEIKKLHEWLDKQGYTNYL